MKVIIEKRVIKSLGRMPLHVSEKVYSAAKLLEQYPKIRTDLEKLGSGVYRMRIGDYRIIFMVYNEQELIVIIEVAARGNVSYSKG